MASGFFDVTWRAVTDLFTHIRKPSGPAYDHEDYPKDDNGKNKEKEDWHKEKDGDSVDYGGQGKQPDEWHKEFGPDSGGQNSEGDYCWWKDKHGKWHRSEEKPEDYPEDCPEVTSNNTIVGDPPKKEAPRKKDAKVRDPPKVEKPRDKDTKSSAPKLAPPAALKLAPPVVVIFVVALQWL